jgi:CheY-like chemotaxis protein
MSSLKSICVIDDDMIYQFAVKLNLKQHQLAENVMTFDNGEEAKKYFAENAGDLDKLPDVILLDINMPIMDGWDFLEWYKANKEAFARTVPVFMVSSSIDWRDIERAKSYESVLDYISKPLTEGNFFEIVHKLSN